MPTPPTDIVLWDWRFGQVQAERLAADILQVEGFSAIDPQAPLGGADGRKDILCKRGTDAWLAGVYFPTTRQEYADIEEKFDHDFEGVSKNSCDGFVFITNQKLTLGERANLSKRSGAVPTEIYHQERLRSILDSPKGYGLRLEYLRIPMAEEEQLGLWSVLKDDLTTRLIQQEANIIDLHRKMDEMLERTMAMAFDLRAHSSSTSSATLPALSQFPTADIQIGHTLWIHRIICDAADYPGGQAGRLRSVAVWIGSAGSTPDTARFVPCPPEEVKPQLDQLTAQWRKTFPEVSASSEDERILAIVAFHHRFLAIHPFLDANGRVARAILQQQLLELTGRHFRASFSEDTAEYYAALDKANDGEMQELFLLLKASLE